MDENQSFNVTIDKRSYVCQPVSNASDIRRIHSQCDLHPLWNSSHYCCERTEVTWSEIWQHPVMTIFWIGFLVILAGYLFNILVLFGSFRRRSGNAFLSFVISMAYYSTGVLVPYIIGRIESVDFKNNVFVVWAMFSILYLGSANSISAYALEDNERWKKKIIKHLIQLSLAFFSLLPYARMWKFSAPLLAILILSCFKLADTWKAFRLATLSTGVASDTKLVADYMHQQCNGSLRSGDFDPVNMRGYNYLVAGEDGEKVDEGSPPEYRMKLEITDGVVTIDKIWSCQGELLKSRDRRGRMKDTCLSFALYKLLRRRYAGYELAEAGKPQTLEFVLRGLIGGDNGGERAFRIVEVELAFLYDSFYTTYPVIFSRWLRILSNSCMMLLVSSWVVGYLHFKKDDYLLYDEEHTILDVPVTDVVVLSVMCLELWQILGCVLSDWAKVIAICKYVEKPSLQGNWLFERVFGFLYHHGRILSPWSRELGQYSLVDSYDHRPWRSRACCRLFSLIDEERKGQKADREVKLPKEVKEAVVCALKATDGRLSNGRSSLVRNGVDNLLSWACGLETLTHSILVWHIATSKCHYEISRPEPKTFDNNSNVRIADKLSRYCAYLVAFIPELLPDHKFITSCIFDHVVKEARGDSTLKGCKTTGQKYGKLIERELSGDGIMVKGARLGRQLMYELEEERRWKVLAEFWAEMMLYLAPSNNVKAHAERLAKGGEFITHLWALLTHAGILDRPHEAATFPA